MKQLRILLLPMNASAWGGSELLWTELARLWKDQGHKVYVGIRAWDPMPAQILELEDSGAVIKRCSALVSRIGRGLSKLQENRMPGRFWFAPLQGWAKKIRPHLIVCSADCIGGLPGIQLSARLGIPYAYIMQANSESWWPADLDRVAMNTAIDAASGCFFFVSKRNRELLEFQLGRSLPESSVCHNPHGALGMPPLPWPNLKIHDSASLRLACIGRLEPVAKGQDLLLQALASAQWSERPWHLSFYGSGHGAEGVKAIARMLGIAHRLSFIPAYHTLEDVWLNHHALVLPSRYEGLPLALVEAMWLGRPAMVTDVADSALLLRDGVDGFVAESPTVKHVEAALERLWEQRNHLEAMGLSASIQVRKYVPSDPVASTSEQILRLIAH